jgi:hypothetical protein
MDTHGQIQTDADVFQLLGKMVLAKLKQTERGRDISHALSPHPILLPRGEGTGGGASVTVGSGGRQSRRGCFHRRW